MVSVVDLLVSIPLVGIGLIFALFGRDLYHSMIRLFGFLSGFATAILVSAPWLIEGWATGGFGAAAVRLVLAVGVAVLFGFIGMHVAWFVYRLTIQFPGMVAGLAVAAIVFAPLAGIDFVFLLIAASVGGWLAWQLHELLLVVNTALVGGVLVGVGVAGSQLWALPVVRTPGRLLADPVGVLQASLAVAQLFVITVVVVFCLGLLVQWGLLPLGGLSGALPSPSAIIPSGPDGSEQAEPEQRTVTKGRRPTDSATPTDTPDDTSGFYEK